MKGEYMYGKKVAYKDAIKILKEAGEQELTVKPLKNLNENKFT